MRIRTVIVNCLAAASIVVSGHAAAEDGLATGQIFGIQVGQPISMSPKELKDSARDHSYQFVRQKAEKPADVQFLSIRVTPISHTVVSVQGATEFRAKKQADAFVAKYVKLLPGLSDAFAPSYNVAPDTPLQLMSPEWKLQLRVIDMKETFGRSGGYLVTMDLSAAFGGKASETISALQRVERDEARVREQRRAVDDARASGGLKGLR